MTLPTEDRVEEVARSAHINLHSLNKPLGFLNFDAGSAVVAIPVGIMLGE